jgi:hypothetical protein
VLRCPYGRRGHNMRFVVGILLALTISALALLLVIVLFGVR